MFAASGGCVAAAELLVEFKADIHAKNPIDWSVLAYASLADHAPMVEWLAQQGARSVKGRLLWNRRLLLAQIHDVVRACPLA